MTTFKQLIDEMCHESSLPVDTVWSQPDSAEMGAFVVDGHLFSLVHFPSNGGPIVLRGDVGPLPQREHHAALVELMRLNFLLLNEGSPVFGVDSDTDRVVVSALLPLEGVSAASVLTFMESLAAIGQKWRSGYLFSAAPENNLMDPRAEELRASLQARFSQAQPSLGEKA